MNILVVIPARGGSKGIPHKNIKPLNGKPLIEYTIDVARQIVCDDNICVSTDDDQIIDLVEKYSLKVPFKRPDYLATDNCGTYDVLLHALSYYEKQGTQFDAILLLQPTSPFRTVEHVRKAVELYNSKIDMVVSVKEASTNPYYNCFEEDYRGCLRISKGDGLLVRRQDAPKSWEFNGAIYIINPRSLKKKPIGQFEKRVKFEMDVLHSIDLDTPIDWIVAEAILSQKIL